MNETLLVPENVEAEQALLGAIFHNNDAYHRVSHKLVPENFSQRLHGDIYDACAKVIGAGRTATPVTLKDYFPDKLNDETTGAQYLARLAAEVTTVVNAPDFAQAILDTYQRRQLMVIADEMRYAAAKPDIDLAPSAIIVEAEKALYGLAEPTGAGSGAQSFSAALQSSIEMMSNAYQRDGSLSGLPTGLTDLDRIMGGLQSSDLIILAARPAMGKTALATNIAYSTATSGVPVMFFSLEMSKEQLATRIIAEQSGISSSVLRRGDIHESQFNQVVDVTKSISELPLFIDDGGAQDIARLSAAARRAKRQHGIGLIVIDYLQLMNGQSRRIESNRAQEVTDISKGLKALAKELDVPVIALAQLSRQVESRDDKRPRLSDLRESGSIEQDADVVLFLYREEYYLKSKEPKEGTPEHLIWQGDMEQVHGRADIIIGKQRHGTTGSVQVVFDARVTKFSNLAKTEYLPERMEV